MRIVVLLAVLLSCTFAPWYSAAAQAGKFPNKGDKAAWLKANPIYNQANALARAGKSKDAIPLYEKCIAMYPFDSDFYMGAATAYLHDLSTLAQAQTMIEKAISLNSTDYVLQSQYAVILVRRGRYVEARNVLRGARTLPMTKEQWNLLFERLKELDRLIAEPHSAPSGGHPASKPPAK